MITLIRKCGIKIANEKVTASADDIYYLTRHMITRLARDILIPMLQSWRKSYWMISINLG